MISFRGVMILVTAAVLTGLGAAAWSFARTGSAQDPAGSWPQFRGPGGSGVAEEQKPPVEFGPDKNVKWKVKAPGGWSAPIVAGDKLVITAFDDGKLFTVAYDRLSGKEVWRKEAPAWFSQRITVGESDWARAFERTKIDGLWAYKPLTPENG